MRYVFAAGFGIYNHLLVYSFEIGATANGNSFSDVLPDFKPRIMAPWTEHCRNVLPTHDLTFTSTSAMDIRKRRALPGIAGSSMSTAALSSLAGANHTISPSPSRAQTPVGPNPSRVKGKGKGNPKAKPQSRRRVRAKDTPSESSDTDEGFDSQVDLQSPRSPSPGPMQLSKRDRMHPYELERAANIAAAKEIFNAAGLGEAVAALKEEVAKGRGKQVGAGEAEEEAPGGPRSPRVTRSARKAAVDSETVTGAPLSDVEMDVDGCLIDAGMGAPLDEDVSMHSTTPATSAVATTATAPDTPAAPVNPTPATTPAGSTLPTPASPVISTPTAAPKLSTPPPETLNPLAEVSNTSIAAPSTPDASPPSWFNDGLAFFRGLELGSDWEEVVEKWVRFEVSVGYGASSFSAGVRIHIILCVRRDTHPLNR
jgi:hypothetical protein